jgi:hypothetical protein
MTLVRELGESIVTLEGAMASDQLQTPERELDALPLGDTKQLRCQEQHQVSRRVRTAAPGLGGRVGGCGTCRPGRGGRQSCGRDATA